MNEPSQWRIEITRKIAPVYAAHPQVEAAFLLGSVARGYADDYSDVEMALIWAQPPAADELQSLAQSAGAQQYELGRYEESRQAWADQFYFEGMKIETAHWSHQTIDNIVSDVVERYDVSQNWLIFEKQATASALQHAVVLYGDNIIMGWQNRLTPYPEALAVAMVQKHLHFNPFGSQEMLAARNEIPLLYENHCAIIRRLLNLLCGLNRIYHPGFKWTRYLVDNMTIKPPQLFTRLESVFHKDSVSGTQELRQLIEETFDLVEEHLPQIDLQPQRETFNRPYQRWDAP